MENFVPDKYDFNEPITVKFTEPNEQSVDIPEYKGDPNEKTDIWTLYHSGKIFDDLTEPSEQEERITWTQGPPSFLASLIESIPTWPEYYEVKKDVSITIEAPEANGIYVVNVWSIELEKGTKICKVEKP